MLRDSEMLEYVHKATEMGRDGIRSVLKHTRPGEFQRALQQQLTEYEKLNKSSANMLKERSQPLSHINPMAKASSQAMSAMQTMYDHSPSKIAEMMIQGNTMGMAKSLKHLHDYTQGDERVQDLATKLLQTEEANIDQMKKFL